MIIAILISLSNAFMRPGKKKKKKKFVLQSQIFLGKIIAQKLYYFSKVAQNSQKR